MNAAAYNILQYVNTQTVTGHPFLGTDISSYFHLFRRSIRKTVSYVVKFDKAIHFWLARCSYFGHWDVDLLVRSFEKNNEA